MGYRYVCEYDIGEQVILDEGTKLLGAVKNVIFGEDRQPTYFVEFARAKQGQPGTTITDSAWLPEAKLRRPGKIAEGTPEEVDEKVHVNPPMVEKAASASFLAAIGEVSGPV